MAYHYHLCVPSQRKVPQLVHFAAFTPKCWLRHASRFSRRGIDPIVLKDKPQPSVSLIPKDKNALPNDIGLFEGMISMLCVPILAWTPSFSYLVDPWLSNHLVIRLRYIRYAYGSQPAIDILLAQSKVKARMDSDQVSDWRAC